MAMKKKLSNLFFAIVFISGGSIAHADNTIAGVLFGSPNQNSAVCYLFNTGSSAVAITSKYLTAENGGGKYALTYDSCKTSISAGKVCAFQATLGSANGGVACSVTLSPSGASIRGELEIRDSGAYHISNVILR